MSTVNTVEDALSHRLTDEDIARAQQLVGYDRASATREYVSTPSADAIRSFALGAGDNNPLFTDPEYGRTTRWGGQIAPGSMAAIINAPLLGPPKPAEIKKLERGLFRGVHVFVSGGSWDFYRPVHVGDTLYRLSGVESVVEKPSQYSGRIVIQTRRHIKINQHAEVVAVQRVLAIHSDRSEAKAHSKYADTQLAQYTPEDIEKIDEIYASETRRGAEPRYWEDVEVGDELPAMVKGPLTVTEIISFHSGGYGFQPYQIGASRVGYLNRLRIPAFYLTDSRGVPDVAQRVHWDSDWAQSIGNPAAYDYGVMRDTWFHHYLTDWIGDDGWVVRQYDEMRRFNFMGDTQYLAASVTGKEIVDGRYVVHLELRMTNQRDEQTAKGEATVALPSREAGPVILPDAPIDLRRRAVEAMRTHGELLRAGA